MVVPLLEKRVNAGLQVSRTQKIQPFPHINQGNGTAAILARDDSIFTLSFHGANNYPFAKELSDLDVALPDGTGDDDYLCVLERALAEMFAGIRPDLIIYLAGADPHEGDRLGRLKLTVEGLARCDTMVMQAAHGKSIPVAIAMVGGYGRNIDDTVAVHLQTITIAAHHARLSRGRKHLQTAQAGVGAGL
jgi:acetoin utilization deacetylase AcuC-like enzyme